MTEAPGAPGVGPTWTSSAKDLVTTAIGGSSRVWLTLGHGIGNEIYWPSNGDPQVRDVGFVVVAGGTWTEVKRASRYDLSTPSAGELVPTVVHRGDGWELTLRWAIDPDRDVVLVEHRLDGDADGLFLLVAPHLGDVDSTNTAWIEGDLLACADDADVALCVAGSPAFLGRSVGFVGVSDGWQDVTANLTMTWQYDRAAHGNVALAAELDRSGGTTAIGLATTPEGARTLARSSLSHGYDRVAARFADGWRRSAREVDTTGVDAGSVGAVELAAAVLACHEDHTFAGATVASLSIPWGSDRRDLGGYHLVWARDCVEVAFARLALGDRAAARRTLDWLAATQRPDGHWTQNAYPDNRPFWTGLQLDETALPVLLAAALAVPPADPSIRQLVRSALRFLVDHGPSSPQDRWEENAGTNAFTLATIVAAVVAGRMWLDPDEAAYATSLADYWNERIEDWLYVADGPLCVGRGLAGYYVRLGSETEPVDTCGRIDVRNRAGLTVEPDRLVALDFLALVRFGLRHPGDARIVDTVTLVDELLAVHLPTGVAYRRYNGDGYGEHDDGSPFDGTGTGRPWPLLAGERGHYEAQLGRDPSCYLDSMIAMTGPGGLLPEQVWDGDPIPERFLEPGRPTGSAMPLAWAHAELAKLATFSRRGRPIEQLDAVRERYLVADPPRGAWHWRVDAPFREVPNGRRVLVDLDRPFALAIDGVVTPSTPVAWRHVGTIDPRAGSVEFELRTDGNDPVIGTLAWRQAATPVSG